MSPSSRSFALHITEIPAVPFSSFNSVPMLGFLRDVDCIRTPHYDFGRVAISRVAIRRNSWARSATLHAALAAVLFPSIAAAQSTIHVPGNSSSIQGAINSAQTGDTILVAPGYVPGEP